MKEQYVSQLGQDKFIDEVFRKKEGLIYLDIGAHNGKDLSNTYFLEKERGWMGILVEPMIEAFNQLIENRDPNKNHFFNCALADYNGEADFTQVKDCGDIDMLSGLTDNLDFRHHNRIIKEVSESKQVLHPYEDGYIVKSKVQVRTLTSICDEVGLYHFDFCSLDTEGSEFQILKGIDYDKIKVSIFIVENNGYGSHHDIDPFLDQKGYIKYGNIAWDDVYIKRELVYA
jgi:FkbM family methyltransferase